MPKGQLWYILSMLKTSEIVKPEALDNGHTGSKHVEPMEVTSKRMCVVFHGIEIKHILRNTQESTESIKLRATPPKFYVTVKLKPPLCLALTSSDWHQPSSGGF